MVPHQFENMILTCVWTCCALDQTRARPGTHCPQTCSGQPDPLCSTQWLSHVMGGGQGSAVFTKQQEEDSSYLPHPARNWAAVCRKDGAAGRPSSSAGSAAACCVTMSKWLHLLVPHFSTCEMKMILTPVSWMLEAREDPGVCGARPPE